MPVGQPYSKEFREKALRLYTTEKNKTVGEIAKEMGISLQLLAKWAQQAGIGRNTIKRRKVGARKVGARKVGARKVGARKVGARKVFTGPLGVVTSLVTDPALNDQQVRRMLTAYLNER